jgi:hypothetical protein
MAMKIKPMAASATGSVSVVAIMVAAANTTFRAPTLTPV